MYMFLLIGKITNQHPQPRWQSGYCVRLEI
jgi:hypothetical protein